MRPANVKLFWAFMFFVVGVFFVVSFAIAPGKGWWLPYDFSTYGQDTDRLFNMILVITSVTFVAVQSVLVYELWKFGEDGRPRKGLFVHGSHKLEVAWTLVPAGILILIAIVQWNTWLKIKRVEDFPTEVRQAAQEKRPFAEVLAGQFEWRITYPGDDGKLGTLDDVHVLNNLHVPKGRPILVFLKSRDVLHSMFLPNLRLKQDAVPGMTIPVWFEADAKLAKAGVYDFICAELCGWGHYKMKAHLTVHDTDADFQSWLKKAKQAEEAAQ